MIKSARKENHCSVSGPTVSLKTGRKVQPGERGCLGLSNHHLSGQRSEPETGDPACLDLWEWELTCTRRKWSEREAWLTTLSGCCQWGGRAAPGHPPGWGRSEGAGPGGPYSSGASSHAGHLAWRHGFNHTHISFKLLRHSFHWTQQSNLIQADWTRLVRLSTEAKETLKSPSLQTRYFSFSLSLSFTSSIALSLFCIFLFLPSLLSAACYSLFLLFLHYF